eukprot:12885340-Prorocentrum_lima.AAC.1
MFGDNVCALAATAAKRLPRAAGRITPPDTANNNKTNTNTLTQTQSLVEERGPLPTLLDFEPSPVIPRIHACFSCMGSKLLSLGVR